MKKHNSLNFLALSIVFFHFAQGAQRTAPPLRQHPLMQKRSLETLATLAGRIQNELDTYRGLQGHTVVVLSLGQSPAYILKMLETLDKQNGQTNRQYAHVAFSGKLPRVNRYDGTEEEYRKRREVKKKYDENKDYYRRYLKKLLEKFSDDQKYVLLEVCQYGTGLKTWLEYFSDVIPRESLVICYLRDTERFKEHPAKIGGSSVPIELPLKTDAEKELCMTLANADEFDDRLVPNFPVEKWKTVNPLCFEQSKNARSLLANIEAFCQNYQKKEERYKEKVSGFATRIISSVSSLWS